MNIRKYFCKAFDCGRYASDCKKIVKATKDLMKAECDTFLQETKEDYEDQIYLLKQQQQAEIIRWQKKYNEEALLPKRPVYCRINECPFNPDIKKKPKLTVRDGRFYYENGGTKEITLIGVSEWKALARILGLIPNLPAEQIGIPSYGQYLLEMTQYGCNYIRQGIVPDLQFIRTFCEDMLDFNVIVELTLHNHVDFDMGDPYKAVDATIDLPNVFYDAHNEFCIGDKKRQQGDRDLEIARDLITYVHSKGGIIGAGAWGRSKYGQKYSEMLDPINSDNDVITVHEWWDKASIEKYTGHGKPVIRNEYYDFGEGHKYHLGFKGFKKIMLDTLSAGAQGVQYLPFIDSFIKPDHGREWFSTYAGWAGKLCKEYNG